MKTTPAARQPISKAAKSISDWIIARRRFLHEHPELSFQEEKTAEYVERELKWLGYTTIHTRLNGNYGICAELLGRDLERCIALRADMDALPIQEETEWAHKSKKDGVSHMCGHDSHTAMLLGAARLLKEREAELPCTVRLFFQGGEEKFPGGARDFIASGMLEGVDSVFGLHVHPLQDTGTMALRDGRLMAGVDEFTITVRGKGGHAATPHETRDPIVAASAIVLELQHIISRRTDPFEPGVVTIGQIHGGSAFNVIPETVTLNGTVRSFRPDMHEHYSGLVEKIATSVAQAHDCEAKVDMPEGYPVLTNDVDATEKMRAAAKEVLGEGGISLAMPIMGSEDFALYTRERPSCFGFLGVSAPADEDRYFLHHPKFHIDEDALWRGAAVLAQVAMNG
ncbi:amidohydrolase [bacterium]|nr:amidohydrolase [bacterium]